MGRGGKGGEGVVKSMNLQAGQFSEVSKSVVGQNGHLVVAEVEAGQRGQVTQPVRLDRLDLVDVEVELGGLRRDVLGYLLELGAAAADDGARTGALGRAVVFAQAALIVFVVAAEVE